MRLPLLFTSAPSYSPPGEVSQFPSTAGWLARGVAKAVSTFVPEEMISPGSRSGTGPESFGKGGDAARVPPSGELSPIPPQSVAANAIRVVFVIGPTATDPSISVSFFARATVGEAIGDHVPVQAYKACAVTRPAAPRTSTMWSAYIPLNGKP